MSGVHKRSWFVGLAVALVSVAAITGINYGLREIAPAVSTGVVYLLAVLLVSSYWDLWLGLLTGFVSAAAFNFFHIPPTGRFTIAEAENWVALGVFFVASVVTSTLANAARTRADEAERRRREADLTAEMARLLLGGSSFEDSLRTVGQRIAGALGLGSIEVELRWVDSDRRRNALPLVVGGDRVGTVLVPKDAEPAALDALAHRVVPALRAWGAVLAGDRARLRGGCRLSGAGGEPEARSRDVGPVRRAPRGRAGRPLQRGVGAVCRGGAGEGRVGRDRWHQAGGQCEPRCGP